MLHAWRKETLNVTKFWLESFNLKKDAVEG